MSGKSKRPLPCIFTGISRVAFGVVFGVFLVRKACVQDFRKRERRACVMANAFYYRILFFFFIVIPVVCGHSSLLTPLHIFPIPVMSTENYKVCYSHVKSFCLIVFAGVRDFLFEKL